MFKGTTDNGDMGFNGEGRLFNGGRRRRKFLQRRKKDNNSEEITFTMKEEEKIRFTLIMQ